MCTSPNLSTRTSNLNLEDDWERGVFIFTIILNIIMLKRFKKIILKKTILNI
jgi:hypothetical protein